MTPLMITNDSIGYRSDGKAVQIKGGTLAMLSKWVSNGLNVHLPDGKGGYEDTHVLIHSPHWGMVFKE